MGYKEYELRIPSHLDEGELKQRIAKVTGLKQFTWRVLKKSLDARKKQDIVWLYRVGVSSPALPGPEAVREPRLQPRKGHEADPVVVVGSGPAGIFAADWLSTAGYPVRVIERGSPVEERKLALDAFEAGGAFPESNNYSFGEGGAGTFSDGKLSSRTKGIGLEKGWIFDRLVNAGGPEEINWLTHPHLGSDRLYTIARNLRRRLIQQGVEFHFDTTLTDLVVRQGQVMGVSTTRGDFEAAHLIIATGHSAFDTYRMLMGRGVRFQAKNFALGFRAEHPQELINLAQWGVPRIPRVKAAEYRLTSEADGQHGVYTFCMCPGGRVVPAAAHAGTNIVNGMSDYRRDGHFANAAAVAGINLETLLGRPVEALEALDWLDSLERHWFSVADGSYQAPAMRIADFVAGKAGTSWSSHDAPATSYPLGLVHRDLGTLLPPSVTASLRAGLEDFSRKIEGYGDGMILGLESKTSAPIQVIRDPVTLATTWPNLRVVGEGSGWSGGIVSSAVDGLKAAMCISPPAKS